MTRRAEAGSCHRGGITVTRIYDGAEGASFPVYQCLLPVSRQAVEFCAGLLTRHLRQIKSPFRSRPARRIVTLVLALLRHDQRIFDLDGGNGISETTLRRWRDELLALLAAQAPRLDRALRKVARRGGEVVLVDGTLIPAVRRAGRHEPAQLLRGT
ncbi:hypothetical protein [Streptomyces sp. NPDC102360]|uniref:hypothetical protein n=1 Tax=Streptomyces sp. NPDC102360 TaxID=3366160 RepID=UPI00380270F4